MIEYRKLGVDEINRKLFKHFKRRQVVTKCWRKVQGKWVIKDVPFIDDWSEKEYKELVRSLICTLENDGLVFGAFYKNELKGFVSVESEVFGGAHRYMDLSNIHVSEDMRGEGIGTVLFEAAKKWARGHGGRKLYISAHSSVESQAFYKKMGCVEAAEYNGKHVAEAPYDCQLECFLK